MKFPNLKESHFLESLWWGLDHLAAETKKIEDRVRQTLQVSPSGRVVGMAFTEFGGGPEHIVAVNYFVWYANSLVPFLKIFAKAYSPAEDWSQVFPHVLKWRNKVAAHTAYTDPRKEDNVYTQDMSIMMSPSWENDSFIIGNWIVGGPTGISHHDWAWSLTETHAKLIDYVQRNKK